MQQCFSTVPGVHSVISAAAQALTDLYGPNFSSRDTTHVQCGLPARSFGSFEEAAQEAAPSGASIIAWSSSTERSRERPWGTTS